MEQKEKITTDFRLPDKPLFARSDLLQTLQLQYPDYDKNTFSWIISKMLATKYLYRLGFDLYSKRKPLVYQGGRPDPLVEKVRSFVLKCDDLGTVVVYDSMFLNEWVNELIAHANRQYSAVLPLVFKAINGGANVSSDTSSGQRSVGATALNDPASQITASQGLPQSFAWVLPGAWSGVSCFSCPQQDG